MAQETRCMFGYRYLEITSKKDYTALLNNILDWNILPGIIIEKDQNVEDPSNLFRRRLVDNNYNLKDTYFTIENDVVEYLVDNSGENPVYAIDSLLRQKDLLDEKEEILLGCQNYYDTHKLIKQHTIKNEETKFIDGSGNLAYIIGITLFMTTTNRDKNLSVDDFKLSETDSTNLRLLISALHQTVKPNLYLTFYNNPSTT